MRKVNGRAAVPRQGGCAAREGKSEVCMDTGCLGKMDAVVAVERWAKREAHHSAMRTVHKMPCDQECCWLLMQPGTPRRSSAL